MKIKLPYLFISLILSSVINLTLTANKDGSELDIIASKTAVISNSITQQSTHVASNILEDVNIPKEGLKQEFISPSKVSIWSKIANFSKYLQTALRTSESNSFRLFLVFFLGLLMSLTPCIYPMIPITAGILQAQGSSSIGRSFLLAFIYTLGTSTTFATFGLVAALTGQLFGQLLVNPIFMLIIISILVYLGLSMFGLYDMYVPKFMEQTNYHQKKGSLFSVFIFGAISGSIASPCLSPGLALLLSIVATLGNNLLGFLMLFIFGLGLSMPLLIVGTFSNSINMIPQNGPWMVEIKKLFGFMLLAMCVYLLSNILPASMIQFIVTGFILGSGIYYLQNISKYESKFWRYLKISLGCLLMIIAVLYSWQIIQTTYLKTNNQDTNHQNWLTDYEAAVKIAYSKNQKLIIDFGADWCSICKAIDKHVLNDKQVKPILQKFILLKVDATDQDSEPYVTLKNKYQILGVPTILVIDPNNQSLLKRWGSELYDLPKAEFIHELNLLI